MAEQDTPAQTHPVVWHWDGDRDHCQPSASAGPRSPPKQSCGTNHSGICLVLREGDLLKGANSLSTLPRWEETLPGRFPRDKFLRRSSGRVHLEKQGEGPFVLLHMMEVHFYQQLKSIFIHFPNKHTQWAEPFPCEHPLAFPLQPVNPHPLNKNIDRAIAISSAFTRVFSLCTDKSLLARASSGCLGWK